MNGNYMNISIRALLNEQFNINDLDFSDNDNINVEIFNKNIVNPASVYDKIIHDDNVMKYEIDQLNYYVSAVKVKSHKNLSKIVNFYCTYYRNDSMNWLDVSRIFNMSCLFQHTPYDGDISQWNVSNVKDMSEMFSLSQFNQNISEWDVSNVRVMSYMFASSVFNGDISGWNVSEVRDMSGMFESSKFNQDISKWDVSNVINMRAVFYNSSFNHDISDWDVSNVNTMERMFYKSQFNKDISRWDVSNVRNMEGMFQDTDFDQDISHWNISKQLLYYMYIFKNCRIREEYKPEKLRNDNYIKINNKIMQYKK